MESAQRGAALAQALDTLAAVAAGVKISVIVDADGLVLARSGTEPSDETLAGFSAALAGLAHKALSALQQGTLKRLLLEGEAGTLVAYAAGPATLALLVEDQANLAQVLFATQKAAIEIAAILTQAPAGGREMDG